MTSVDVDYPADDDEYDENDLLPSPGGWEPPANLKPGWDWVPRGGASPSLEAVPCWVRALYQAVAIYRRISKSVSGITSNALRWASIRAVWPPPRTPFRFCDSLL